MIDLLILVVVLIGLTIAVYHIAQHSTKETSFEDAIQEQRQKRENEIVSSKIEKALKKGKVKKVKSKKEVNDSFSKNSSTKTPVETNIKQENDDTGIVKVSTNKTTVTNKPPTEQTVNKEPVSKSNHEQKKKKNKGKEDTIQEPSKKVGKSPHESNKSENKIIQQSNTNLTMEESKKNLKKVNSAVKTPNASSSATTGNTILVAQSGSSKGTPSKTNPTKDSSINAILSKTVSAQENKGKQKVKAAKLPVSSKVNDYSIINENKSIQNAKLSQKNTVVKATTGNPHTTKENKSTQSNKGSQQSNVLKVNAIQTNESKSIRSNKTSRTKKIVKADDPLTTNDNKSTHSNKSSQQNKIVKTNGPHTTNENKSNQSNKGSQPNKVVKVKGSLTTNESNKNSQQNEILKSNVKISPINDGGKPNQLGKAQPMKISKENSGTSDKVKSTEASKAKPTKLSKGSLQINEISSTNGSKGFPIKNNTSPIKDKIIIESKSLTLLQEQMQIIENQMKIRIEKKKKPKNDVKQSKLGNLSDDVLTQLIPVIHKSNMNGSEIQMLIEILLNKQQLTGVATGKWVEKGRIDPAQQVKRQLVEAEAKLKKQLDTQDALSAKISELRTDLNGERARSSGLKRQLDGAVVVMKQKLDAVVVENRDSLTFKIIELKSAMKKEFEEKLVKINLSSKSETEIITKQIEKNLLAVEKQLQQSRATNNQSEQTQQKLQGALVDAQQQLKQAVLNRDELMQTCQQYQQHINVLKDQGSQQDACLNARIIELQKNLTSSEEVKIIINSEREILLSQREQLQHQLHNAEEFRELLSQNQVKLKDNIKAKCELEAKLCHTEKEVENFADIVTNQNSQIERLIEEKEILASHSIRPAAEGRENGDIHPEHINSDHILMAEYEEKLSSLTKEIFKLKEDVNLHRRKNDEYRDKYDQETRNTTQVLLRLFPSIEVADNLEQVLERVEIAAIAAQKPQIIEKIIEKIVQDPAITKQLEEMKSENNDLHKRVKDLSSEVSALKDTATEAKLSHSRIQELVVENKSLDERVTHYQTVLSDTESLLKTLQSSVESEESIWKEKFVQKEELVCQLKADKTNLAFRNTELQGALDTVKQAEQMDSQLTVLKEKLETNEKEKGDLREKLVKVQEMLKSATFSQTINANGPANGVDNHESEN